MLLYVLPFDSSLYYASDYIVALFLLYIPSIYSWFVENIFVLDRLIENTFFDK